ncbi:MAG: amidohydrolase [Acidobacteriota bacterium]|nr:MAG: amidohydrolase [Acidobacteriota bacterium]
MKTRLLVSLFLITGLVVNSLQAQTLPTGIADLALINGRIWTGTGDSFVEAVAIRGNRIADIGATNRIKKMIGPETQVVDLKGQLAAPGFNDAHIHFLGGSLGLNEVDLNGCKTVAEMIERIGAWARKNPDAEWVKGRGWEYTKFPGGLPTKSYLDAVVRDRPVFLSAYDGHSAWVNSKALELAEIDEETRFDGYGEIVRNASGEPTGALKEGAQSLVRKIIPPLTREEKLEALRKGLKLAASLGITSIQNASGSPDDASLYAELLAGNELTVRVSIAFSIGQQTTKEELGRLSELRLKLNRAPMLRADSVKIMLDGVIESHTAAMIERYSDLPAHHGAPMGILAMPTDQYRELVLEADRLGFQIYTHAIGDRAVREALNAYEAALRAKPGKLTRHRIEHIETISPADMRRFSSLGVLASMEPIHADPGTVEVWARAVGPERLPYSFAWASLLRAGARLVFSSDWPAAISINPIRGLHSAVNRRTTEGDPPKGWVPEERISITEAMKAYTSGGAYASFEEHVKGLIAPNMLADIAVFSQDLFKCDPEKIHETRVVMTIFDGKIIFQ